MELGDVLELSEVSVEEGGGNVLEVDPEGYSGVVEIFEDGALWVALG